MERWVRDMDRDMVVLKKDEAQFNNEAFNNEFE
jgi:hypothetical protein